MNSKQTEADYVPYGPEWEKEMSKFPKLQLIKMLGKAYQEKKELKQSLPSKPVGDVEEMNVNKIGDNILTELKKDPNHITKLLNKDEETSYNTGFHTGFQIRLRCRPAEGWTAKT